MSPPSASTASSDVNTDQQSTETPSVINTNKQLTETPPDDNAKKQTGVEEPGLPVAAIGGDVGGIVFLCASVILIMVLLRRRR